MGILRNNEDRETTITPRELNSESLLLGRPMAMASIGPKLLRNMKSRLRQCGQSILRALASPPGLAQILFNVLGICYLLQEGYEGQRKHVS